MKLRRKEALFCGGYEWLPEDAESIRLPKFTVAHHPLPGCQMGAALASVTERRQHASLGSILWTSSEIQGYGSFPEALFEVLM